MDKYSTYSSKNYLNLVRSYFVTTRKRLVENYFPNNIINIQSKSGMKSNNQSDTRSNFKFNTIGSNDVINILQNLNNNSSPGPDGFTILFIKQTGDNIIFPFVYIINCSIIHGTVPDKLKIAKIVRFIKKNDKIHNTNIVNLDPSKNS